MDALCGAIVAAPEGLQAGWAVGFDDAQIVFVGPETGLPSKARRVRLDGGVLAPGFIDLQVNGGGGVLLNDDPTPEGVAAIARAHRQFGTTGLLPTLISDDVAVMRQAIEAAASAIDADVPGVLGLHLEGPFLNAEKNGVHDASKFATLTDETVELCGSLGSGVTLVTLAPETAPPGAIRDLTRRGVVVAAGHTNGGYEAYAAAIDEGMSGFTHLFNAMSPLTGRAPNAVGAALDFDEVWCGVIADGHHVHDAALRVALRCKGRDKFILVTDAMPTVGAATKTFHLGAELLHAENGRIANSEGRLAGSDLDMMTAVKNAVVRLGAPLEDALHMAAAAPAQAIGLEGVTGRLVPGLRADMVHFTDDFEVRQTWINGRALAASAAAA
ncbi:MAG: N-acetylglucosamine-6-phosphate deacetylase [Pseudomonadota bacterium]